ncbi:MAG: EthD domain-containing protein [Sphingomonadales bacterium]|nr:EthD domain-containing protein [Sphingomonadales bacterium]MDE2568941.1 EthD domain-containing protein [Sphingomonadales bacterium]
MSITLVTLLKRREGMSKADFTAYYETNHRRIGEDVLSGFASRYVRKHLVPVDGETQECDADVVLQITFPDQERMDAFFAHAGKPDIAAMIAEDEEKLFDRSRIRVFTVEQHESDLPPVG